MTVRIWDLNFGKCAFVTWFHWKSVAWKPDTSLHKSVLRNQKAFELSKSMRTFCTDCAVSLPGVVEPGDTPTIENVKPQLLSTLESHVHHDSLNIRKSMFHIFISYRVSEIDTNLVRVLYSSIISQCRNAKRIPFADETVFPKEYKENELAKEKLLNLFWDTETLADGRNWTGDGTRIGGGFIGAIMQSLVFVPVLTTRTLTKMKKLDVTEKGQVDNVLLELTVAKFLCEYQNAIDQDQQRLSLWPCSFIFPIIGSDVPTEVSEANALNCRVSRKTNEKAFEMLTKAGYTPDKQAMLEGDSSATHEDPHPWSVLSIVRFFLKYQGKMITELRDGKVVEGVSADVEGELGKIQVNGDDEKGGAVATKEEEKKSDKKRQSDPLTPSENLLQQKEMNECSERILKLVVTCISSCKEMQVFRERSNPLASEMQNFLDEYFLGHFMHILNSNGVNSILKLSRLENHSIQLLSAKIATQLDSSEVEEFCKLRDVVLKAQTRKESQPLNQRLHDFFDQKASWSSALSSTCAVDLLMRKPFYLFVMIVGSAIFAIVGIYLLVFPTVYSRSFPGTDNVQTISNGLISTAILCLVGAVGIGPICIGFSYLGSPKKGRYAAAYAFWLPLLIVQTAGFVGDNANLTICKYFSLDTTAKSIQDCIIVYAVTFGIKELYFLSCFLAVVLRQELYWPFFTLGLCMVMSCNYFIYQYSQSSLFNIGITTIVIILVFGLYITQRYNMRKTIRDAQEKTKNDAKAYGDAFKFYKSRVENKNGVDAMSNGSLKALDWSWKHSTPGMITLPWEDSKYRKAVEQSCNDLERLYALAELVNLPFHQLIDSMCSSKSHTNRPAGLASSECKDFLKRPAYAKDPEVYLGPIKSTERAIEKVHIVTKCFSNFL